MTGTRKKALEPGVPSTVAAQAELPRRPVSGERILLCDPMRAELAFVFPYCCLASLLLLWAKKALQFILIFLVIMFLIKLINYLIEFNLQSLKGPYSLTL